MNEEQQELTPRQKAFLEWLHHPITLEVHQYLRVQRQELLERWANGAFTDGTVEGTVQLNAKALAMVDSIDQMLDIDVEALDGVDDEE